MTWLEAFKECFGHRAQVLALRRYVQGLLSDSQRKSMEAMLARVTEPGSYQAFQHFITHAPWSADRVWRRLRAVLPEREGLFIVDATTFLKQGTPSVGVGPQWCGLQRQVANCQKAVTAALWTGARAYVLGAALYLPEEWLTDTARAQARIPATVRFRERWRLALTLLRQARASGIKVTGVLADAEFGDTRMFRAALHRLRLPYALGVSSHLTAFLGTPYLTRPRAAPGSHQRRLLPGVTAHKINELITAAQPCWQRVALAEPPRGAAVAGGLRRDSGDTGHRSSPSASAARNLAARRTRGGPRGENAVLLRQPASHRVAGTHRAIRASTLGHRAAISRT